MDPVTERLRVEALRLAVGRPRQDTPTPDQIVEDAKKFEAFLTAKS